MKLTTRINLILAATFALGLLLVGVNAYLLTQDSALRQVTDQAELMMQEALAVRSYTVNEIRPLLNRNGDNQFYPQTVPAYSATQIANLVQQTRPDYSYREAVFNPTNPRDKATPTEAQIINQFIANPALGKLIGSQEINGVKSLYISYPIRITDPKCLACHSEPENAPAAMRAIYGDEGGFGWQLNEVVGTQMVVVPYTLPAELARTTFISFLLSMAVIFLIIFLVINIVIRKLVLKPVWQITRLAEEVSKGNLRNAEIKVKGNDEIADMLRAFNRMRRSIIKLVQMMKRMQARAKDDAKDKPQGKPGPNSR